jgi:hypothetical protein
MSIAQSLAAGVKRAALALLLALTIAGCSSFRTQTSPNFTIASNQKMLPVLPFTTTLVPESFSEAVFNDYVDALNDNRAQTAFSWFGIVKDDINELEKLLPPANIFLTGEIWSYIENSGCCSTEMRVKSRLRIYRLRSRELLWGVEIPMESFFEHDRSTLAAEREKLARRLTAAMTAETLKALHNADIIVSE